MTGDAGADDFKWNNTSVIDSDNHDIVDYVDLISDFSGAIDGGELILSDILADFGATAATTPRSICSSTSRAPAPPGRPSPWSRAATASPAPGS